MHLCYGHQVPSTILAASLNNCASSAAAGIQQSSYTARWLHAACCYQATAVKLVDPRSTQAVQLHQHTAAMIAAAPSRGHRHRSSSKTNKAALHLPITVCSPWSMPKRQLPAPLLALSCHHALSPGSRAGRQCSHLERFRVTERSQDTVRRSSRLHRYRDKYQSSTLRWHRCYWRTLLHTAAQHSTADFTTATAPPEGLYIVTRPALV